MKGKVLFVLSSHDELGDTGEATGFDVTETAVPYRILENAGYAVEFATPDGQPAAPDPASLDRDEPEGEAFQNNQDVQERLQHPLRPEALDADDYDGIFFPGGHGTMWDFPDNAALENLARTIFEDGGVVAAICHGGAALVNVQLSDGSFLVDGKLMTCFTNEEEQEVELDDVMPFLLESALRNRGAQIQHAHPFDEHVEVDGQLLTGQNPASAQLLGEEFVELLDAIGSDQSAAR